MANVIAVVIIVALVTAAIWYIRKEKKKGTRCIGCPMAGNCTKYGNCDQNNGIEKTKE